MNPANKSTTTTPATPTVNAAAAPDPLPSSAIEEDNHFGLDPADDLDAHDAYAI